MWLGAAPRRPRPTDPEAHCHLRRHRDRCCDGGGGGLDPVDQGIPGDGHHLARKLAPADDAEPAPINPIPVDLFAVKAAAETVASPAVADVPWTLLIFGPIPS